MTLPQIRTQQTFGSTGHTTHFTFSSLSAHEPTGGSSASLMSNINGAVTQSSPGVCEDELYHEYLDKGLRSMFKSPSNFDSSSITPSPVPALLSSYQLHTGGSTVSEDWAAPATSCPSGQAMRSMDVNSEGERLEIPQWLQSDESHPPTHDMNEFTSSSFLLEHAGLLNGEVYQSDTTLAVIELSWEHVMEQDSWDTTSREGVIQILSIHEDSFIKKVVPCEPEKVFSASRLIRYNQKLKVERLHFPQLLQMLQLQEYKLTIQLANHKAISLRERYDSPGYLDAWERPFKWTDPASPLLDYNEEIEGTLVVVSDRPCSIPHIIISAPEPQDPDIAFDNATNDPQDYGFGKWLTVPSVLASFINVHPGQSEPWYSSQPHSISRSRETNDDSNSSAIHDDATIDDATPDDFAENFPEIDSRAETPAPLTPEMPVRGLGGCSVQTADNDDDEDTDVFIYHGISTPHEDLEDKDSAGFVTSTPPRHLTRTNQNAGLFRDMNAQMRADDDDFEEDLVSILRVHENFDSSDETETEEDLSERDDEEEQQEPQQLQKMSQWHIDEDEEDLPPLDDWYQSVADRTNMKIHGLV